jgi:hypothetical protein
MIRLAIGRALLWLIEPAETERDEAIRGRTGMRASCTEAKEIQAFPEGPLRPFLTDPDRPRYPSTDG